ncbi:hypothetical protein AAFF_G00222280 [Aldrovandia affinis]|uniref:Uncharacterized protein n=1 Tax=Aldrovandia affinis TaxID=143900 RepID=A0AAD7W4C0_9TELE|nr:hypothetical protein AAFF_G00222280 [Aldrovandia affinis]
MEWRPTKREKQISNQSRPEKLVRLNRILCKETWLETELESDWVELSSSELTSEDSDTESSSSSSELPELLVADKLEPKSESLSARSEYELESVSLLQLS